MARLVEVLGLEWVRRTPVLTSDDLREVLSVEPVSAAAIAVRLTPQLPSATGEIRWLEEPDLQGQLVAQYLPGTPPTGVVPQQPSQTPEQRTALVARCLGEHILTTHTEFGPLEQCLPLGVDLLCVLNGTGLFAANTDGQLNRTADAASVWSLRERPRRMSSRLFGYAFALRCRLCEEHAPAWTSQLRPDAREPLERGLKFLKKRRPVVGDESGIALRTFDSPPALEGVLRRLRQRDAAVQINALDDVSEFGMTDEACLHELADLVHDHTDEVREETIRTIDRIDVESPPLGDALVMFCDDHSPRVRTLAALALGVMRRPPPAALESLLTLTKDAEPSVSAAAAESLLRFPEAVADERPRLFRILRQQLARCHYERVDRFVVRLSAAVDDAAMMIEHEFSGAEDEAWRNLLLQSLETSGGAGDPGCPSIPERDSGTTPRLL